MKTLRNAGIAQIGLVILTIVGIISFYLLQKSKIENIQNFQYFSLFVGGLLLIIIFLGIVKIGKEYKNNFLILMAFLTTASHLLNFIFALTGVYTLQTPSWFVQILSILFGLSFIKLRNKIEKFYTIGFLIIISSAFSLLYISLILFESTILWAIKAAYIFYSVEMILSLVSSLILASIFFKLSKKHESKLKKKRK